MNIFFYTTWISDRSKCYLKRLQELPILESMTILPAGSLFLSPLALKLRSGDLLLLFAANTEDLKELLTLKNEFNDFRIILILGDSTILREAYTLRPRFIALHDEAITRLEAVIKKTVRSTMPCTQN